MRVDEAPVLCIAGFDPSGAAGLTRDLWALQQLGGTGFGVTSCLTVQTHTRFVAIEHVPADYVGAAIDALVADHAVGAVKVGLVDCMSTWETLLPRIAELRNRGIPIVVDPVRAPTAGGFSHGEDVRAFLAERLPSLGVILTPNLPELDWLGDVAALLERGAAGVLVKGGHAEDAALVADTWHDANGSTTLRHPRHEEARRGTGCVLSTLFARELATGLTPVQAIRTAGHQLWRLWPKLASGQGQVDTHSG